MKVDIDLAGIESRLLEVPVPAGNYSDLSADGKRLYFMSRDAGRGAKPRTEDASPFENKKPELETFIEDVIRLRAVARRQEAAGRARRRTSTSSTPVPRRRRTARDGQEQVPLKDWTFHLDPREEWRQMFTEAWRLERDYFYDRGMHGLDWPAIQAKYLPLVDRVTDRAELSDLLAQMVERAVGAPHLRARRRPARKGRTT